MSLSRIKLNMKFLSWIGLSLLRSRGGLRLIFLGVVGVFLLSFTIPRLIHSLQFHQQGKQITATVTKRNTSVRARRRKIHWLHYEFNVEGNKYFGKQTVTRTVWQDSETGNSLQVVYLSSNPDENRILGKVWSNKDIAGFVVGIILCMISFIFLVWIFRDIQRKVKPITQKNLL